ncbi:carbohydrate ABC transporter permease [Breznakiella homolactica]|uniref:Sugar ABC transporter permease n=1 Tax=Breznakiella homolactica TaxID=2798577 RepID=A0A7T7XS00_9SPIR|nr:sugar ABC transporter permease [Breznakiella homolactica]QQO11377.1 sugar ABC transporter permease [Breznakiella homolactica]
MKYLGIEKKKARWGWVFVMPAIVLFLLFSLYPMLNAFYNTFFNIKLLSLRKPEFVGFRNYIYVLNSPGFWNSVKATVIFTLGAFIPLTVFSMVFGMIITTRKAGQKAMQLMIYAPAILSSVVAALIWMLIFDPRGLANSAVNFLMRTPGVDHHWLTDTVMIRVSTITIYVWKYVGYFTIIFVTGIAKIPQSVLEAATIDGATAMQTIRKVILPLLKPTTVMVSIVAMLNCLKSFSTQYLFTQRGAPLEPIDVITLNIYNTAMRDLNISRACVMSVLLFIVMMILTLIRMNSSERNVVSY